MLEETISIVTDDTPSSPTADTRSWEIPESYTKRKVEVSVERLEQEMAHFLLMVDRLFNRAQLETAKKSNLQLDEIELSVEINGEGQVSLIGSGVKAGGKGAITLKFKRPTSD